MGYYKELDIESADAGRTHEQSSGVEPIRLMPGELTTEVAADPLPKFDLVNMVNFADRIYLSTSRHLNASYGS